jgi:hypothetical protein
MKAAAIVFFILFVALPLAVVMVLFIWAAIQDGREDREVRARLRDR